MHPVFVQAVEFLVIASAGFACSRLFGLLFRKISQPQVVVDMLIGVAFGALLLPYASQLLHMPQLQSLVADAGGLYEIP